MSHPVRVLVVSLVVAFATSASGCGGPPSRPGTSCSSDDQCRADARCSSHSCVANAPPIAEFGVSGALETSSLVTLDGSTSRDPDSGDGIVSYAWSIEPDGAPCPPPQVASTGPVAQVRFGCAGQFRARLIVVDRKHAESTPAIRPLQIQARSAPALVEAGADQSVGHLCSGAPITCRPATAVRLAATTTAEGPVAFRWTVQPPPARELDEHRRVRFIPDASALAPTVEIETDGTAISGDWQFRVEVMDGVGVLDADVTRVSVTNRAPVIRAGPSTTVDHLYDASSHLFTASGTVPVEIIDEDGDSIERQVAFRHAGDGGAAFLGEDLGTAIRFSVTVPFGKPEDALWLRGAEGLDRSIALAATDVNGASTALDVAVIVGNRAPAPARASTVLAAHSYDSVARLFRSQLSLGQWVDPDGDPVGFAVSAGAECPTFTAGDAGTVQVQCSRAFTGVASLAGFLQQRQAQVTVHDPWDRATTTVPFRIGNQAPLANQVAYLPVIDCRPRSVWGPWCHVNEGAVVPSNEFPAGTFYAAAAVSDPDGDPIQVSSSASANVALCSPGQPCTLAIRMPESISCESTPPDVSAPVAVTDGVESSSGLILLDPVCR